MLKFGIILAGLVAAAALAADTAPAGLLDLLSVKPARQGGRMRSSFSVPTSDVAKDLRRGVFAVRIAGDATAVFDANTRGLKIHRSGFRAKYKAPKRSGGRIQKFSVSMVAGSFDLFLRGERLQIEHPPLVELTVAGRLHRFDPAFPDGPPPAVIPLPEGPVTFNTCTRNVVSVASTVESTVLRSPQDLAHFLTTVTPYPDDVLVLQQNDFSTHMILVAVGDGTAQGVLPWSVRITGVESIGGVLAVDYDKYRPVSASPGQAAGGTPSSTYYHAIAVPTSGMAVRFDPTSVAAQNPWN